MARRFEQADRKEGRRPGKHQKTAYPLIRVPSRHLLALFLSPSPHSHGRPPHGTQQTLSEGGQRQEALHLLINKTVGAGSSSAEHAGNSLRLSSSSIIPLTIAGDIRRHSEIAKTNANLRCALSSLYAFFPNPTPLGSFRQLGAHLQD